MKTMYQRDRVYSLVVGNEKGAIEINSLNIKFNVTKSSDNTKKKNNAWVEIYNLSEERRKALDDEYVNVELKVGYAGTDNGLITLFTGQVVNRKDRRLKAFNTKRSGTDLITRLDIDELFVALNTQVKSKFIPSGVYVRDIILEVIQDIPEITRNEMNGNGIQQMVPDGYQIDGEPRRVLDGLSKKFGISWQIDQGVLYVSDKDKSFQRSIVGVPLIGQMSGLIDRPEFVSANNKRAKKAAKNNPNSPTAGDHIKMKILLNPTIVAGSYFKLDFEDMSGYYRVDEVVHEGNFRSDAWWSTLTCSPHMEG